MHVVCVRCGLACGVVWYDVMCGVVCGVVGLGLMVCCRVVWCVVFRLRLLSVDFELHLSCNLCITDNVKYLFHPCVCCFVRCPMSFSSDAIRLVLFGIIH